MVAFGVLVYLVKLFLPFDVDLLSKWLDLAGILFFCRLSS
jgi:hypothetical protein